MILNTVYQNRLSSPDMHPQPLKINFFRITSFVIIRGEEPVSDLFLFPILGAQPVPFLGNTNKVN